MRDEREPVRATMLLYRVPVTDNAWEETVVVVGHVLEPLS